MLSPTPLFALLQQSQSTKGFISNCYAMLLGVYLGRYPNSACERWKRDVGDIPGEQWEEALEAVSLCYLNVSQRLSQLYLLLRVYRTPLSLYSCALTLYVLDVIEMQGRDLIHLMWRCLKLHPYWNTVVATVNTAL